MDRFDLKKLNMAEGISSIFLKSRTDLKLWKTWCGYQHSLGNYWRKYKSFSHRQSTLLQILKQYNPRFDAGHSKLSDKRKQVKLQWLQDQGQINGHDLNNVQHETRRYFCYLKRDCPTN
jgi:hypothetical protein